MSTLHCRSRWQKNFLNLIAEKKISKSMAQVKLAQIFPRLAQLIIPKGQVVPRAPVFGSLVRSLSLSVRAALQLSITGQYQITSGVPPRPATTGPCITPSRMCYCGLWISGLSDILASFRPHLAHRLPLPLTGGKRTFPLAHANSGPSTIRLPYAPNLLSPGSRTPLSHTGTLAASMNAGAGIGRLALP